MRSKNYSTFLQYHAIETLPHCPYFQGDLPNGLSTSRLLRILRGFGEYPERHRFFIWRSVLQLPENQAAFSSLQKKGTHIAYAAVEEKFPVKSPRLLRILQRYKIHLFVYVSSSANILMFSLYNFNFSQ